MDADVFCLALLVRDISIFWAVPSLARCVAHGRGDHLDEGQLIAEIEPNDGNDNFSILSPFKGVLRGLIRSGIQVTRGMKIGDVDHRNDPAMYTLVSDKALAVGGGVLEALLVFMKASESRGSVI